VWQFEENEELFVRVMGFSTFFLLLYRPGQISVSLLPFTPSSCHLQLDSRGVAIIFARH
jgi:hypothetical protein